MGTNCTRILAAALFIAGLQAVPAASQTLHRITDFDGQLIHKAYSPPTPYAAGTRVSCNWQGRGRMYNGMVARRLGPSTIHVHYDNGDRETTLIGNCRFIGYGGGTGGGNTGGGNTGGGSSYGG